MDRKSTIENIRSFLDEAKRKKIQQIGFADHDMYLEELDFDLIKEIGEEYPELQIRIGLEVDYREEREDEIAAMLAAYSYDYVIGSVHQLGGWFFDYPEEEAAHNRQDSDILYQRYFSAIEKAARSGLFDIIGHFDLIKIFNIRPKTDVKLLAFHALEAVRDHGLVLELNTNGRYKPVKEFYPEPKLIDLINKMGIPFTLGSDAHEAGAVGRDLQEAAEMLKSFGVKDIIGFKGRKKYKLHL